MQKLYIIKEFLSKEECTDILNKCKSELELKVASTKGGVISEKRKSSVAFIEKIDLLDTKLKNKLEELIQLKGYKVTGLGPHQFTEYKVGEYYDWHVDSDNADYKHRFASIVIQLNDDYEEGYLQVKDESGENTIQLDIGIGNMYIFYSNLTHRVVPVKSGIRYSLVNWVSLEEIQNFKKTLI